MPPNKEAEFRQQSMFIQDQDGNLKPNPSLVDGNKASEIVPSLPVQTTDARKNEQLQKSKQERTEGRVFSHFSNPDP